MNSRWLDLPTLLLFCLLSLSPTTIPVSYWILEGKLDWSLFVNVTQATVTWEKGTSTKKMSPSDLSVAVSM